MFGHTIQHPINAGEGQRNASVSHQLLKCNWQMDCLHLSMLQMGGGTNNTHGSLVITEHMWNPLCTNVSFPQGADGDMVSFPLRCWWGYGKHLLERFWLLYQLSCMNYCMYNQGWFHFFHMAFNCHQCWGSTARGIISLFLATLHGICPSVNSFTWRSICP